MMPHHMSTLTLKTMFMALEGRWQLSRKLTGSEEGTFEGESTFEKTRANHLEYNENGIFSAKAGQQFKAANSYIYKWQNNTIKIYFAQNPSSSGNLSLFQTLKQINDIPLKAEGFHLCRPDTYTSLYTFYNEASFQIEHEVSGPKKNYMMQTRYNRL